jgi:hypothetical protein
MMLYKAIVLNIFFVSPKHSSFNSGSLKMLEQKSSKLWLCQKKMELESSGSGLKNIFGAEKLQLLNKYRLDHQWEK